MSRVYPDVCTKVRIANSSAVSSVERKGAGGDRSRCGREEVLLYARSLQQTNCKYDLAHQMSGVIQNTLCTYIHTYIYIYTLI